MNLVRKSVITVVGGIVLLLGVLLSVLPGPAIFVIPLGLMLLSLEYPWARKALRKFQRFMTVSAARMDRMIGK